MFNLVTGIEKVLLAIRWPSCFGSKAGIAGLVKLRLMSLVRSLRVSNISSISKSPEIETNAFSVV